MMGLFALAAVVQINDPDPLQWIAVYAGAMAMCALFAMDEMSPTLGFVFSGACLIGSLVLFMRALERTAWQWDEGVNEPVGLFVIFLWISTLAWLSWKGDSKGLT